MNKTYFYLAPLMILLSAAPALCDAPATQPSQLLTRVEFRDVAMSDAARLLADQSGVNIVCSSDAAKTHVSLFLQNIPARVAVEELCKANNLTYSIDDASGVVRISTVEEFQRNLSTFRDQQTQVFTLLYPNAQSVAVSIRDLFGDRVQLSLGDEEASNDLQDLQDRLSRFDLIDQYGQGTGLGLNNQTSNSNITSQGGVTSIGNSSNSYSSSYAPRPVTSAAQNPSPSQEFSGLTAEQADHLARLLEANPGTNQQQIIDQYRRSQANIFVSVVRRNNMVVVRTADPDTMKEIQSLIQRLDVPTPLVLLEVKVLQLDLTDGFDSAFDVQYGGTSVTAGFSSGDIEQPAAPSLIPGGTGVNPTDMIFQVVNDRFRARIQLLESKNRVTQLAAPLLLTANNEVSRLFVGQERPIVQSINSQVVVNNNSTTTVPNTTISFQPVGTTLLITPNINADRTVTLRLLQENSQILTGGASIPIVTSNGTIQSEAVDVVSSQTYTGTVVAKDALTLAVGGLIQEQVTDQRDQIPVLGDIPLLGILFRRQDTQRSRQELVILIRPYILNTPADSASISQNLVQKLSIHPMAGHFDGTMGTYLPDEVPTAHPAPANKPLERLFQFHSIQPADQ